MITSQVSILKASKINGWMSEQELAWLANQARENDVIVEFGSFHGRSTRALADNCDGIIYAVDPWNGDYFTEEGDILKTVNTYVMPQFLYNLNDHVKSGKVKPVRAYSTTFKLDIPVDMVFIDGDHRYESVKKDIEKALSLLRDGGVISGHDYNHPLWTGVKMAVDEILGPTRIEDTIWWTRK